jgi:cell shape-determining protein MreD
MTNLILFFVLTILIMVAVRYAVHYFYPTWGTVWSNALAGFGLAVSEALPFLSSFLIDAATLPWSSVLDAATAEAVAFGILVANMIMRKLPRQDGM